MQCAHAPFATAADTDPVASQATHMLLTQEGHRALAPGSGSGCVQCKELLGLVQLARASSRKMADQQQIGGKNHPPPALG